MKKLLSIPGVCCLLFFGCQKEISIESNFDAEVTPIEIPPVEVLPVKEIFPKFISYTIQQGHQSCDSNIYSPVDYSELKFVVKFDSSAIYTTTDPSNQYDINKLYGFSDNNSQHHQYSARFGWRWSDNALRLFGYIYNDGIREWKELGPVIIGNENVCSIKVTSDSYIFTLNEMAAYMPRKSTTINATGYKLYPYFGGDEKAPHNIIIAIKEL